MHIVTHTLQKMTSHDGTSNQPSKKKRRLPVRSESARAMTIKIIIVRESLGDDRIVPSLLPAPVARIMPPIIAIGPKESPWYKLKLVRQLTIPRPAPTQSKIGISPEGRPMLIDDA